MRVRVQNFQSIKDATVDIRGFVVITGPNNSGKTAFMRAIRGLFTNAPAGPLLRKGEAYLSVEITFEDGTTVLWEKGWAKPDGKGGGINRYTLNGKELSGVGRGVPPEVEALGVRAISAGTSSLWPQIADQFDGTLFLVNKTGSVAAEALSDVSRVGKLTEALRLSERDRRSVVSELKVRRKDLMQTKADAEFYDGLDLVEKLEEELSLRALDLSGRESDLKAVDALRGRYRTARSDMDFLKGFDPSVVPPASRASQLRKDEKRLAEYRSLQARLVSARKEAARYEDFDVTVPDPTRILRIKKALSACRDFRRRWQELRLELSSYEGLTLPEDLPTGQDLKERLRHIAELRTLKKRLGAAREELATQEKSLSETREAAKKAEAEVTELLGVRGNCPTCGTTHTRKTA